jgi:hypothetical protein
MEEDVNTLTSKEEDWSEGECSTPPVLYEILAQQREGKESIRREMSFCEKHHPEQ